MRWVSLQVCVVGSAVWELIWEGVARGSARGHLGVLAACVSTGSGSLVVGRCAGVLGQRRAGMGCFACARGKMLMSL